MSKSENLYAQAQQLIPGGVNSPVRAFTGVGGIPLFIERADGAYLFDVDGKAYIDYVGSWGPMILGHNHPAIRQAVIEAVERGLSFGAPTEMEVKMAQLVTDLVPTMDMVRMVNSGTEATMSAIRLARGYTGRDKIINSKAAITPCRLFVGKSRLRRTDTGSAQFTWCSYGFCQTHPDLYL